jgi:hypothetical protein
MVGASTRSSGRTVTSVIVGDRPLFRRVMVFALVAPALGTLLYALRVDSVYSGFVLIAWGIMLCAAVVVAGYAGWHRGALLAGWLGVLIATLWAYVVTPLVAHLQGDEFGERTYGGIRFAMVGYDPLAELEAGLLIGSVIGLLAAIVLGTSAFAIGAGARWLAGRVDAMR